MTTNWYRLYFDSPIFPGSCLVGLIAGVLAIISIWLYEFGSISTYMPALIFAGICGLAVLIVSVIKFKSGY